jgi:hypothetical protein
MIEESGKQVDVRNNGRRMKTKGGGAKEEWTRSTKYEIGNE